MSMTQDAAGDKIPDRNTFLRALFAGAPNDLYLELRCIHPDGKPPRTFWSKVGDKMNLVKAFNRAKQVNAKGYGVYFAPCLRREKIGKAESAALLTALWVDIDCDGDVGRYNVAYDKLNGFELPPSAVVDSGGGVHAYWFMAEAVTLNEASRDKAAAILRGLSEALGGDQQYVKSVASVMRLPGSINTKSERNNAEVTVLQLESDRRYSLDQFTWLESKPLKVERVGGLEVVTLNGNHPLPARTETYLASGASEGSRNHELFAAACQLRDAGYSEAEAAGHLVPRHVASGSSEGEAVATIKSAYSRPPREPILAPRERVTSLVERYKQPIMDHRPTTEEIRGAVRACASLDPIEWATERQRIKTVCGDGLKASDLDRLYRESRRSTQQPGQTIIGQDGYTISDGCMVYERHTERGTIRQVVAEWVGCVDEAVTRVDEDQTTEHLMRVTLNSPTRQVTLDIPSELFGDPNALARWIAGRAGGFFSPRAGMHKHLAPAILKLSGEPTQRQTYRFIGWTRIDGRWVYVSPNASIDAKGAVDQRPEVELESRLRDYNLTSASWEDGLAAFRAMVDVLPKQLAPTLISFALLPILQRFFPAAAPKPALHLVGTTGSGKSEIAALMTSFYGNFLRDTPPAQWGDTVNTVEVLGYAVADGLFWVDDWKSCYADEKTFTRFLQSYSRGMGRGRLTREAKLRQEKACRGLLLSTGESTMEGEASILSRMMVVEIPPWEKRDAGGMALMTAERLRGVLTGFTSAFAAWVAQQADAGTLTAELAASFERSTHGYRQKLASQLSQQANTGRMIGNWAVLVTVYQLLLRFLIEKDADDALPSWRDVALESVRAVQGERAGHVFLDVLGQLLAGGQCALETLRPEVGATEPETGKATVIGYRDPQYVYILPNIALREVERVQPLNFTANAICTQLREDGVMTASAKDGHTGVQLRIRQTRVRVWKLRADCLG